MHPSESGRRTILSRPTQIDRRLALTLGARLVGGAILAAGVTGVGARRVAADDRTITLAGAASRLTASPGSASAEGAIAAAAATRGMARVQATAALAGAQSDGESFAHGAAALAAADPNRGAITQSAAATASALAPEENTGPVSPRAIAAAPAASSSGKGGRSGGGGVRRLRGGGVIGTGRQRQRGRQRDRVNKLPIAGVGDNAPTASSLFGVASGIAAVGAFFLRRASNDNSVRTTETGV